MAIGLHTFTPGIENRKFVDPAWCLLIQMAIGKRHAWMKRLSSFLALGLRRHLNCTLPFCAVTLLISKMGPMKGLGLEQFSEPLLIPQSSWTGGDHWIAPSTKGRELGAGGGGYTCALCISPQHNSFVTKSPSSSLSVLFYAFHVIDDMFPKFNGMLLWLGEGAEIY